MKVVIDLKNKLSQVIEIFKTPVPKYKEVEGLAETKLVESLRSSASQLPYNNGDIPVLRIPSEVLDKSQKFKDNLLTNVLSGKWKIVEVESVEEGV